MLSISPLKNFSIQPPLNLVLGNVRALKLKSSSEIPDYKIPQLVMPSTWL